MKTQKITLEQQVCLLELAKKLKELEVEQISSFYWDESDGVEDRLEYSPDFPLTELVSAFTASELGEMLPDYTKSYRTQGGSWVIDVDLIELTHKVKNTFIYADTEADARALMLIHLIENKLIKI